MTPQDFENAFIEAEERGEVNIVVVSHSGKEYWVHRDQLDRILDGGLAYGVPLAPHPYAKQFHKWFDPKNITLAEEG